MPKKHALIKDEISETSITTDKKQKISKKKTYIKEETSIDEISVKSENEVKPQKKTKKPKKMLKNLAEQVLRASLNSKKFIGVHKFNFPIDKIIPHGSYLMNPGSPEPEKLAKTREAMLEECRRCELLNIQYYNFHPVETMAGSGNTIGNSFQELRDIIDLVEDKSRVGVCIDTCHIFAAGYDLRTEKAYAETMEEFEKIVGFNYLKAVHLNDSKAKLNSKVDRHENIGRGELKLDSFKFLMRDSRFDGIPLILETPEGMYEEEMIELYEMELD